MDETKRLFFQAIREGNVQEVNRILQEGDVDVNSLFQHNETPNSGQQSPVTTLAGGYNNYEDSPGRSEGTCVKRCVGDSPLHQAAEAGQTEICKILIRDWKAHVNVKNTIGNTPLHLAALKCHPDVCQVLLKEGKACVDLKNDIGHTPLHKAVDENHPDVCRILIEEGKANVNLQNKRGTLLHRAAGQNHTEICKILIEKGKADVNSRNKFGDTPLHRAAYEKRPEACKILIEDGDAKVNRWNKERDTPLHTAAEQNCPEVCELLVQVGKANANIKNKAGNTPLHHAVRRNHAKVAKILLEMGHAETDIKNKEGRTALDYKFKGRKDDEIFQSALQNVTNHKLMEGGERRVKRVKLFMCGNPRAGKTTLMNSMSKGFLSSLLAASKESDGYSPTPGIRVKLKTIKGAGEFVIWDMAGHVEFHVTHAMFLGKSKGIFIIAYDASTSEPDAHMAELKYWLSFLKAGHDPEDTKPQVVIVGTHLDKIRNVELAEKRAQYSVDELIKLYGDFLDIHKKAVLLDARKRSGKDLDILKETLNQLAEPLRGERMPRICEEISKHMLSWCQSDLPLLRWTRFVGRVKELDPLADEDFIKKAVACLHDTGKLFHAKIADHDDIITLDADWLTSKIFGPIFSKHDFALDHPGLNNQQEYTERELTDQFNVQDPELLTTLLQHFELAYCHTRGDMKTFIIPPKLPPGVKEIDWQPDASYTRYTGFRIECQDITDIFTVDTFPCIQVRMMNRYQQDNKPVLSHFGLKVVDQVEGMLQLTKDKRAIHVAVREKKGVHQDAAKQILEMKQIVLDELKQRSIGTKVTSYYLSPKALSSSRDLVTNMHFFSERQVEVAENSRQPLADNKLNQESVSSVKGCLATTESYSQVDDATVCSVPSNIPSRRLHHQQENSSIYLSTTNQSIPPSIIPASTNQANRQTRLTASQPILYSPYQDVTRADSFNRQTSLPVACTSRQMIHYQQDTPPLQHLLVASFSPLAPDRQHLNQSKCGPKCGWNCIPLKTHQEVCLLIDGVNPDPHGRDYHAMAEAFCVPREVLSQMKNFQARDPSLTSTLIKVVYMYRMHQGRKLSIQEVLTVIKHPGIVGNEDAAKLIEEFLARIGHHEPFEAYELNFGIPDQVLLHRAVIKQTRDHIRHHIKPSDIAVYLESHLTVDDVNEIKMCEDEKTYNYPKAADLLIYKLMQLRDTEWYSTLLSVIQTELYLPLTVQLLEQEKEQFIHHHPVFSKLSIADETKPVRGPPDDDSNPIDINDLFRMYSPPVPPPKIPCKNPVAFKSHTDQQK